MCGKVAGGDTQKTTAALNEAQAVLHGFLLILRVSTKYFNV